MASLKSASAELEIGNALALGEVELVELGLTDGTLPVGYGALASTTHVLGKVGYGRLEIAQHGMGHGTEQQQVGFLGVALCHAELGRQAIDHGEELHRLGLVELVLAAHDIELVLGFLVEGHVEGVHLLVVSLNGAQTLVVGEVRQLIHRQIAGFNHTVLHLSTILALVLMLVLWLIIHHDAGKLVGVYLRTLAHFLLGLGAPTRLAAEVLFHLCFHDAELVQPCLAGDTQLAIQLGLIV